MLERESNETKSSFLGSFEVKIFVFKTQGHLKPIFYFSIKFIFCIWFLYLLAVSWLAHLWLVRLLANHKMVHLRVSHLPANQSKSVITVISQLQYWLYLYMMTSLWRHSSITCLSKYVTCLTKANIFCIFKGQHL